jgi:hypothetical protein
VVTSATGVDASTLLISLNHGFWEATQPMPQIFSAETDEEAIAPAQQLVEGTVSSYGKKGAGWWRS